jgi:hypothetical protein
MSQQFVDTPTWPLPAGRRDAILCCDARLTVGSRASRAWSISIFCEWAENVATVSEMSHAAGDSGLYPVEIHRMMRITNRLRTAYMVDAAM